ncbi:MAG: I78 family peptidase inhibitor [Roseovarius sp.]
MSRLIALPAITLLLMACQAEETASEDTCGAQGYAALVVTAASDHDFTNPNRPHRVIPPNSAVTMDYRPDRLNVDLDEAGQITRFWCG